MGYEAVQSLLIAPPDAERQEIIDIDVMAGVSGAHDLRTRGSQPTRFIQIHLKWKIICRLVQAHFVADRAEQKILRRFPGSRHYSRDPVHRPQ